MSQFQSLMAISPLGLMYGSAGGFLSPENLVGRSNNKFPPDAATVAGLIFNTNRENQAAGSSFIPHVELSQNLTVAGPFWAKWDNPTQFYVPIPRHYIIDQDGSDMWMLVNKHTQEIDDVDSPSWQLNQQVWEREENQERLEAKYHWQNINDWGRDAEDVRDCSAEKPWQPSPFLHPKLKTDERHVVDKDGLFLENAIQLDDDYCLVYLTTLAPDQGLSNGWYRLGGEGHIVEVNTHALDETHIINEKLKQSIGHACALITPAVWGSNNYSYRYPQHSSFPKKDLKMLTDKPIPYRYRIGQSHEENGKDLDTSYDSSKTGRLSRGRYAVPPGSVYVFREPLNRTWWEFPEEWFPKEGFPLKHLGCGLCLPVEIKGLPNLVEV
jgi:CRISPR-associated protein Cmr3